MAAEQCPNCEGTGLIEPAGPKHIHAVAEMTRRPFPRTWSVMTLCGKDGFVLSSAGFRFQESGASKAEVHGVRTGGPDVLTRDAREITCEGCLERIEEYARGR